MTSERPTPQHTVLETVPELEQIFLSEARSRLERLWTALESPSYAQLEAHRLRGAARAVGHPLEQIAFQLERAFQNQSFESPDLDPEDSLTEEGLDLLEHLSLPSDLRQIFRTELEQALTRLERVSTLGEVALELHRLRSASWAVNSRLEPFLALLEGTVGQGRGALERGALEGEALELKPTGYWQKRLLEAVQRCASFAHRPGPVQDANLPPHPLTPSPPASPSPSVASSPLRPPQNEQVRVSVKKLGTLLAETGELSSGRIRLERRLEELREVVLHAKPLKRGWKASKGPRRRLGAVGALELETRKDLEGVLRFLDDLDRRWTTQLEQLEKLTESLKRDLMVLGNTGRTLEEEVLSMRLLPASALFGPLERLTRDLALQLGKQARFVGEGGDLEIDRKLLEGLRDPLMHMLRNALDHGLETPERRRAVNKNPQGTVTLRVRSQAQQVEIVLEDDGGGLNLEAIRRRALERGLLAPDAGTLEERSLADFIFAPGFSTAAQVTDTSGRGVGMDVVRENIRTLGGSVTVRSSAGKGSAFVMQVPLTLATTRVLLLRMGAQTLALPTPLVERALRVRREELYSLEGHPTFRLGEEAIPVLDLSELLSGSETQAQERPLTLVLLRREERRIALRVDAVVGEGEVVVKPLGWPLSSAAHLQGAATLGSGELIGLLSASELFSRALSKLTRGERRAWRSLDSNISKPPRLPILVVDDSITTRTLERTILETAGYATFAAVDGLDALEVLKRESVSLVLTDVEMPRMDGFSLTEAIRADARLQHLPVIVVTSLSSVEHRSRGAEAGADAYIVKGEFEQGVLLETVKRLLV